MLGQEATDEKSNEITAIPALVERINLAGALVSIDAMGCNPNIAQSLLDAKADYLLAVKDNQPTLHAEIKSYFDNAPSDTIERSQTVEKSHGRLEIRTHTVSHEVDWMTPERSYPGAFRFPKLTTIAMVESRIERGEKLRLSGAPTSRPGSFRPTPSPTPCAATGPSRTTFIGRST